MKVFRFIKVVVNSFTRILQGFCLLSDFNILKKNSDACLSVEDGFKPNVFFSCNTGIKSLLTWFLYRSALVFFSYTQSTCVSLFILVHNNRYMNGSQFPIIKLHQIRKTIFETKHRRSEKENPIKIVWVTSRRSFNI